MNHEEKARLKQMREQAQREYVEMLPGAIDALRDIITDPEINPIARVQAIGLIMDRGLGKPEENIRIQHMQENIEKEQEWLDEIFTQVRKKAEGAAPDAEENYHSK